MPRQTVAYAYHTSQADLVIGTPGAPLDQEFNHLVVASQRLDALLDMMQEEGGDRRVRVHSFCVVSSAA